MPIKFLKVAARISLFVLGYFIISCLIRGRVDVAIFLLLIFNSVAAVLLDILKQQHEHRTNNVQTKVQTNFGPVISGNDVEHLMEQYDLGYLTGVQSCLGELCADKMLYGKETEAREIIQIANDLPKISKVGKFSLYHNKVVFETHA